MATNDTTLSRVRKFMSQFPGGVSSEFIAGALGVPVGDVLRARVALANENAAQASEAN